MGKFQVFGLGFLAMGLTACTPSDLAGMAGVVAGELLQSALRGGSTALPAPTSQSEGTGLPETSTWPRPAQSPTANGGGLPGLNLPSLNLPTAGASAPSNPDTALAAMEQEALAATNAFRSRLGKSALVWDPQMAAVARAHSADMGLRAYFSHNNPDNKSPFDRMRAAGVSFSSAAENIYMTSGQGSAQGAIDAWDKSPGHHANMAGSYGRIGLGISREGGNGTHFTQLFAN